MDNKSLNKHIETLKKGIFLQIQNGHILKSYLMILQSSQKLKKYKTIVSLERGSLYGNISLFAPLFKKILFL